MVDRPRLVRQIVVDCPRLVRQIVVNCPRLVRQIVVDRPNPAFANRSFLTVRARLIRQLPLNYKPLNGIQNLSFAQ